MNPSPSPSQATSSAPRVVAVVVTFNRRELLELTLRGIVTGDLKPEAIVLVNNASTDTTGEYLEELELNLPVDIVHLSQNMGGAGGFTVGIDRALARHDADLVWVMDDDTEPTENTLNELVKTWEAYEGPHGERPAFVASKVVWDDGRDHPMNTMNNKIGALAGEYRRARAVGARPIRSASFVSIMMDAAVIRREGLPLADYFIWNDDFEFTTRLSHHRFALATERSVALHHTKTFATTNANPGPRFYYDVRNKLWTFTQRRSLSGWEKFLYTGATARLWITTLLRCDDPKLYAGYLFRGIKDALGPIHANEEVLKGVYDLQTPQLAQDFSFSLDHSDPQKPAFAVLMATYGQDRADFLDQAIASNLTDQTVKPDEFVVVADGPLSAEQEAVLQKWQDASSSLPGGFQVVRLAKNRGLAAALNAGMEVVQSPWVARADADDISLPERFERQIDFAKDSVAVVVGGFMEEVDEAGNLLDVRRTAPLSAEDISRSLPHRNPMLHPTVIFRKDAVLAVGGYEEVPGAEDYWLWARLERAGFELANIAESLVKYRSRAAYEKRGGLKALTQDIRVQQRLYHANLVSGFQGAQNLALRSAYRFFPSGLRQKTFRRFFASSSTASTPSETKEN